MPLPSPRGDEEKDDFISRCIEDVMDKDEAEDSGQAAAICNSQWDEAKANSMKDNATEKPEGQYRSIRFQQSAEPIERRNFQGREHVVVPVVALVEGVLQGANAASPELALAEEFGKFPDAWNGRPVTLGHPMRDNRFVSASSSPEVHAEEAIGTTFNARVEDKKLKVDFFLDPEKAPQEEIDRLQSGQMLEVSTGFFAERLPQGGEHSGERFDGVLLNIMPDHIALLNEGEIGACSVEDGCGAPRINVIHPKKGKMAVNSRRMTMEDLFQLDEDGSVLSLGEDVRPQDLADAGNAQIILVSFFQDRFVEGEVFEGRDAAEDRASILADEVEDDIAVAVPVGLRDDGTVVYRKVAEYMAERRFMKEGNMNANQCGGTCGENCQCKTKTQDNTNTSSGKLLDNDISFSDNDPQDPSNSNIISALAHKVKSLLQREELHMADANEKTKEELVDAVIANEATPFDEGDKESLSALGEEKLKSLAEQSTQEAEGNEEDEDAEPAANKGQDLETFKQTDVYQSLPDNVRDFMERKMQEERDEAGTLADKVASAEITPFTKDQLLKKFDINELRQWGKTVDNMNGEADYSGLGGPQANGAGKTEEEKFSSPRVGRVFQFGQKQTANAGEE